MAFSLFNCQRLELLDVLLQAEVHLGVVEALGHLSSTEGLVVVIVDGTKSEPMQEHVHSLCKVLGLSLRLHGIFGLVKELARSNDVIHM